MAGLFEQFATDKKAELEGIEVSFGTQNNDGSMVSFRVARMGDSNKRYKAMMERETKAYAHAIRTNTLDPEIDKAITLKVFCHTVLTGWSNLIVPQVFDTEDRVAYTPENAMKLLSDPRLHDLYIDLISAANQRNNFRAGEIQADSKN